MKKVCCWEPIPIGKCNKKWWDSFLHISLGLNSLPGTLVLNTHVGPQNKTSCMPELIQDDLSFSTIVPDFSLNGCFFSSFLFFFACLTLF